MQSCIYTCTGLVAEQYSVIAYDLLGVISLAIRLPVADEARAALVQELITFGTLEAGRVPLQVRRHPEDKLVLDLTATPHAHGKSTFWIQRQGDR